MLVLLFQDDEEDEEDDYTKAIERIQRRPKQKLRNSHMEFNQKYYKANALAGLAWSDRYTLSKFYEEGDFGATTQSLMVLHTAERSNFDASTENGTERCKATRERWSNIYYRSNLLLRR